MLEVALRHAFGPFTLDVAFAAPPGVTALFGRSGSGKTSIVNAVAGLLRPDWGRVAVGGAVLGDTDAAVWLAPHRRRLGYVFQEGRLFPHLSVAQNLGYGRWFGGGGDMGVVVDLLGLGPLMSRRPGGLSGGEKQRVAIGRALLTRPRLLLMDEPLASLDGARKAEILPYLERLRDEAGVPILYVSHALDEVARLATTVVVVEGGRIARAGPAAGLLADPEAVPDLGPGEAGSLMPATLVAHHADGLSELAVSAGRLWLPRVAADPGARLRVRILARDVMLGLGRPEGLSALNILPAHVLRVWPGEGPGAVVQLRCGQDVILARVTRRSATALGLAPGVACSVIVKSVAVARGEVGAA